MEAILMQTSREVVIAIVKSGKATNSNNLYKFKFTQKYFYHKQKNTFPETSGKAFLTWRRRELNPRPRSGWQPRLQA